MEWLLNKLMRSISNIKKKGQVYMENYRIRNGVMIGIEKEIKKVDEKVFVVIMKQKSYEIEIVGNISG